MGVQVPLVALMHFLIIDNGTSYIDKIKLLLNKNSFEIFNFNDESLSSDLSRFDAVILSGGHVLTLNDHVYDFSKEINIVLNSNLPIFGICFGFQLIASVFGATLIEMKSLEKGIIEINKNSDDILFEGVDNFEVFENHRLVIKNVSDKLVALAYSKDGIEIIKHIDKPIYGVQFHPEMYVNETCGDEIFRNFIKIIKK